MDSFTVASFLHLFMRIALVGGLVFFMIAVGERALGFDVKQAINDIERQANQGNVWPITALLCTSLLVLGYLLG